MRKVSLWVGVGLVASGLLLWQPSRVHAAGPGLKLQAPSQPAGVQFLPVQVDSASGQLVFVQGPPSYGHAAEGPPTFTPPAAGQTCTAGGAAAGAGSCPHCQASEGGVLDGLKRLFGCDDPFVCPHGLLCRHGTGCPICCRPKYWGPTHHHTYYYSPPRGLVYPPQNLKPAIVQYPFYTVKGPTDFFYNE